MAQTVNRGSGTTEHYSGQPSSGRPATTTASGQAAKSDQSNTAGMAQAVRDKAQDMATTVASTAEEAWESTRHGVEQAASAVATTASDSWQEMTRCMQRHPFATLGVGIGVGFVLSRLLEDQGGRSWGGRNWGSYPFASGPDYRSNAER